MSEIPCGADPSRLELRRSSCFLRQLAVTRQAVVVIEAEAAAGRDMVNRVLRMALDGRHEFEHLSVTADH